MQLAERIQHIKKIQSSGLTPEAKIQALEAFVKQEKQADEEEKKAQDKALKDQQKEEKQEEARQQQIEADLKLKQTTQKVEIEGAELITIKGDKGDKGDSIVGPKGDRGEPGKDGKSIIGPRGPKGDKGDSPSKEELTQIIIPLIPEPTPGKDAEPLEIKIVVKEVVKHLKTQTGKDRLHIKQIDGIDKFLSDWAITQQAQWQSVGRVIGGGNFKAGANITISPDGTISSSGGGTGGYTVETPTGTVDGSNTSFVVTVVPVYIVSDGATYFANNGYTISGLNITMSVPPTGYIRSFHA